MIEVKNVVLLDFKDELDTLTKLKNGGQLDAEEEDKSFNYMLDQLDAHYRGKDGADFSLDLYDIRNIMNILLEHHRPLIDCYTRVVEYLES